MFGGSWSVLPALAATVLLSACGASSGTSSAGSASPSPTGTAARAALGTRLSSEVDQAVAAVFPKPTLGGRHLDQEPCTTESGGAGALVRVGRAMSVAAAGPPSLYQMQLALERLGWTFTVGSTVTEPVLGTVSTVTTGTSSWGATITLRSEEDPEQATGGSPQTPLTVNARTPCIGGDVAAAASS